MKRARVTAFTIIIIAVIIAALKWDYEKNKPEKRETEIITEKTIRSTETEQSTDINMRYETETESELFMTENIDNSDDEDPGWTGPYNDGNENDSFRSNPNEVDGDTYQEYLEDGKITIIVPEGQEIGGG